MPLERAGRFFESVSKEILFLVAIVVAVVLPVRAFVAQPFVVDGLSMYPTFEHGDYLIIDEFTYHLEDPKRGEVVVFRYPGDPSVFYIKRVIGLPGETLSIKRGEVVVAKEDGTSVILPEPYVVAEDITYTLETTLGPEQYFVMGDNRPKSSDSRVWGPLPKENITGRALVRLLPFTDIELFPGAIDTP